MKSWKNIFKLSRSQWISAAVLASSLGLAAAVTIPNVFTSGQTISSATVNANFNALNGALPLVWSSTDTGFDGVGITAGAMTTLNSMSINAPSAGFLVVSGGVFVNNMTAATKDYITQILIDGVATSGFTSSFMAAAAPGAGYIFTLSHTVTVPITAGAHTVAQAVGPQIGTADYFYNANNLTAQFYPSAQATQVTVQ